MVCPVLSPAKAVSGVRDSFDHCLSLGTNIFVSCQDWFIKPCILRLSVHLVCRPKKQKAYLPRASLYFFFFYSLLVLSWSHLSDRPCHMANLNIYIYIYMEKIANRQQEYVSKAWLAHGLIYKICPHEMWSMFHHNILSTAFQSNICVFVPSHPMLKPCTVLRCCSYSPIPAYHVCVLVAQLCLTLQPHGL